MNFIKVILMKIKEMVLVFNYFTVHLYILVIGLIIK